VRQSFLWNCQYLSNFEQELTRQSSQEADTHPAGCGERWSQVRPAARSSKACTCRHGASYPIVTAVVVRTDSANRE